MFSFIKKLSNRYVNETDFVNIKKSKWKRIDPNNKPKDRVVILTFDSIDCGWTMDIGWWNEKDQTWMVNSEPVSYPFSHYQELPEEPPESEGSEWRKEDNKWIFGK